MQEETPTIAEFIKNIEDRSILEVWNRFEEEKRIASIETQISKQRLNSLIRESKNSTKVDEVNNRQQAEAEFKANDNQNKLGS